MEASDPITAAQRHLVVYAKLFADTIWEVQQMTAPDDEKVRGALLLYWEAPKTSPGLLARAPLAVRLVALITRCLVSPQPIAFSPSTFMQVEKLGDALKACADTLDDLVQDIPDYRAEVGTDT
jgi:hypothetical protein